MFSLIITIISIALVAALALTTLYYGGAAFNQGAARAEASKILLQGQQLLGASDLYFTDNRVWPAAIADLVTGGYLKQIPVVQASGLSEALAAGKNWTMIPNAPTFLLVTDTNAVCAEVNLGASLRKKAILKQAYSSLVAQCYGAGTAAFTTVFRKDTIAPLNDGLGNGIVIGDLALASSPPTDPNDLGWSLRPVVVTGGGTGGAGGGGGTGGGTPPVTSGNLALTGANFGNVDTGTSQELALTLTNSGSTKVTFNDMASDASKMWETTFVDTTCPADNTVASIAHRALYALADVIPSAHAIIISLQPRNHLYQVNYNGPWAVPANSSCTVTVRMNARTLGMNNPAPGIGTLNNSTVTAQLADGSSLSLAVTGVVSGVANDDFQGSMDPANALADGTVYSVQTRIYNNGNTLMKSVSATSGGAGFSMDPGGFSCIDLQPKQTCFIPMLFQLANTPSAGSYLLNGTMNVSVLSSSGGLVAVSVPLTATNPGGQAGGGGTGIGGGGTPVVIDGPKYVSNTNASFNNAFFTYDSTCAQNSDPGARNTCELAYLRTTLNKTCVTDGLATAADVQAGYSTHFVTTCQ